MALDFYEQIIILKKRFKKTNVDLGVLVDMTGDAFRMALKRKSLSNLQIKEIENYFVKEHSRTGIDSADLERASQVVVKDSFEQYSVTSKNGHETFNMPDGTFLMKVPLIQAKAYALYISEGDSVEWLENAEYVYFKVDHAGKGRYRAIEVKGDSFWNEGGYDTPDKAIALIRELPRYKWVEGFRNSPLGWVIFTKNNGVLKDIVRQDLVNGIITCHSRNPSPEYSDFDLSLDEDVLSIWKVIKRQF